MISSVAGVVASTSLDHVVVEVGGVGLKVHTTPATAGALTRGGTARLFTTLVVREESLTLFGFAESEERDLFEQVQTVAGVGPRLALAMLAVHPPQALRAAISGGDVTALMKVPGIGRKGGERIVLELRDKVAVGGAATATGTASVTTEPWRVQVREALVGLGWTARQADDAVERVAAGQTSAADATDVSSLLRAALRELGR